MWYSFYVENGIINGIIVGMALLKTPINEELQILRVTMCKQFLDKQIIGNADLDLFIRRQFHTYEQRSLFHSLLPAYLAMILTLAITIYQEWDNNQDMEKIYNHLSTIEQQLEDTDNNLLSGSELEMIEQQLNAILEKDFGNESINDKLQELLEAIKNIEVPDNYSITIETDKD